MILHFFTDSSTMIIYSSSNMIIHSFTKSSTIFDILCIVAQYKYHYSSHSFVHHYIFFFFLIINYFPYISVIYFLQVLNSTLI